MIVVHETFVCKPGNASKLAKMFKEGFARDKHVVNILTDMTGQFNKILVVSQYEDMNGYVKAWEEYANPSKEMQEDMAKLEGYQDMYVTGSREIYRVW